MQRYIGITGFKTVDEINYVKELARDNTPQIMYGILTSQKGLNYPTLTGSRRPAMQDITSLLEAIPKNGLPMIHHCTDNRNVSEEVLKVFSYDNMYDKGLVNAVQINQRLPELKELEKIKNKMPNLEIVLQLEPEDLEHPKTAAIKTKEYGSLIDYVIIDPSRGIGKTLDLTTTLNVLNGLREYDVKATPVIAGGLSGENVTEIVEFFKKEYGDNFSIDSEGRLREFENTLSRDRVKKYLENAYRAYK
jgi:phosphoribosylanthranilate isomerase